MLAVLTARFDVLNTVRPVVFIKAVGVVVPGFSIFFAEFHCQTFADSPGLRPSVAIILTAFRLGTELFELFRSEFGQNSWNP